MYLFEGVLGTFPGDKGGLTWETAGRPLSQKDIKQGFLQSSGVGLEVPALGAPSPAHPGTLRLLSSFCCLYQARPEPCLPLSGQEL